MGTKVSGAVLLMAVLMSACLKTEEFPKEPHIDFKSYTRSTDYDKLTISFTDGDGDIGLDQGDTLAPYNPCLLYTSPSPRDRTRSRMPSSA